MTNMLYSGDRVVALYKYIRIYSVLPSRNIPQDLLFCDDQRRPVACRLLARLQQLALMDIRS